MRLIQLATLLSFFCACKAQPKLPPLTANKDENTLLWEVSGKDLSKPSYLFGTFHLMCKDDIHFSDQLKTALTNTDTVYMEMDMDDPATMLGAVFLMNMKEGKKLKDLYTEAEYEKITTFFKDTLHIPITMFQSTKPFFLMAMLYPSMMPCKKISGVEEELGKLAKASKKEINGLETMAFQASVFDSIPYEEQAKELLKSIDSMRQNRVYFDTMMTVYKSQQLGAIEALFSKSEFGMTEHQDVLLDNRNKDWVRKLKKIMSNESVFVAVGAGHLVGKLGLIELLRKEGYTLRPIKN